MSFNCLRKIFGPNAGLSISAETRPVIYPGDDDKGRMGVERNAKLIRFATVLGYVLSVSIAATLLSLYYVFIWDPSSHQNSATLNASQHPVDRHPITTSNPGDESSNATLLRPLLGNYTNDSMFSPTSKDFQEMALTFCCFFFSSSIFSSTAPLTSLMEPVCFLAPFTMRPDHTYLYYEMAFCI